MFAQQMNYLTGELEWVSIEGAGDDDSTAAAAVGGSLYLDMLTDLPRNRAYRQALDAAITPGRQCQCLDIGTGTGLLSLLAARAGTVNQNLEEGHTAAQNRKNEDSCRVLACDVFPPMAALATRIVAASPYSSSIRVLNKRSDELTVGESNTDFTDLQLCSIAEIIEKASLEESEPDMERRADVIVSEIFDSELLGEGLLPSMRDAQLRLLAPGGTVIPARAVIWGQLIQSTTLHRSTVLLGSAAECGSSTSSGSSNTPVSNTPTWQGAHALHLDPLFDSGDLQPLSEPFRIFSFDLAEPPAGDQQVALNGVTISKGGNVHAVAVWWRADLDREAKICLHTAPCWVPPEDGDEPQPWRDHWKQCWVPVPSALAVQPSHPAPVILAQHDDVSVRLAVLPLNCTARTADHGIPTALEALSSPSRRYMLNDEKRRSKYAAAVDDAMQRAAGLGMSSAECITSGDGTFLPRMVAGSVGVCRVRALQEFAFGAQAAQQSALGVVPHVSLVATSLATVIAQRACLGSGTQCGDTACHVFIAEPFYRMSETLPPWTHLRFWHERDKLVESQALHRSHVMMPCAAHLMAVAVSLPELWRTRQPLLDVEGLDFTLANQLLGGCDRAATRVPILAYEAWQCGGGYMELTERVPLLHMDFQRAVNSLNGVGEARVLRNGTCHAVLLWMDYDLDPEGKIQDSTGPQENGMSSWRQGVVLLPEPVEVCSQDDEGTDGAANSLRRTALRIEATFHVATADISIGLLEFM